MAHLWINKDPRGWQAERLPAQFDLALISAPQAGDTYPGAINTKRAQIIRAVGAATRVWALILAPESRVLVNGRAVLAGLVVLGERDEIRIGGTQLFFSMETLAVLDEFPPQERTVFCGRCRQPIIAGSPAVRCPGCNVWYNQSADLPCWTYTDKCSFCGHPTALDAGF